MASELKIPLDIPDVEVLVTEITDDGRLLIKVESQVETTPCRSCGQQINCTYGHGQQIELRHLSVLGLETYLQLRPRRGQSKDCRQEPTPTQVLSWYEPRSPHTKAYDQYLLKQLVNRHHRRRQFEREAAKRPPRKLFNSQFLPTGWAQSQPSPRRGPGR